MKKLAICLLLIFGLTSCSNSPPTPYPTYTPYPTFIPNPTQTAKIEILETTAYRDTISDRDVFIIDGLVQNVGDISVGLLDFSVICKGFYSDGRLADVGEKATKPDTLKPGEQGIFHFALDEWKPGQACCPQIDKYSCEIIFYDW